MTAHPRLIRGLAMVAVIAGAGLLLARQPTAPQIDLAKDPQTVYLTIPFAVGDTYTFGSTAVPSSAKRSVGITGIRVIHAVGIEVVGYGAMESTGEGIGLVPGWPPAPPYAMRDPFAPGVTWDGEVQPLVGGRVIEPKSGLRGIEVAWSDADGIAGSRVFDFAVITCGPRACARQPDDATPLLRELGLVK